MSSDDSNVNLGGNPELEQAQNSQQVDSNAQALEPEVELVKNTGIPEHKLSEIRKIVEKYADTFKQQFRDHIGKRIDD